MYVNIQDSAVSSINYALDRQILTQNMNINHALVCYSQWIMGLDRQLAPGGVLFPRKIPGLSENCLYSVNQWKWAGGVVNFTAGIYIMYKIKMPRIYMCRSTICNAHFVSNCDPWKTGGYCIPRTKYVRGILWFSRRYAAASAATSASADTSSFSR